MKLPTVKFKQEPTQNLFQVIENHISPSEEIVLCRHADTEQKYQKLKKWLEQQGIEIPISIEPYTYKEYQTRIHLFNSFGDIYLSKRDREAMLYESCNNDAPWMHEEL